MEEESDERTILIGERLRDFRSTGSDVQELQLTLRDTRLRKYEEFVMPLVAEFVGMLIFTFMHSMAAQSIEVVASAINDGFFVAIMVVTIGHISGAHVNAAVTIAVTLAGGLRPTLAPLYILVQLAGSLAGAALAMVAYGRPIGSFEVGADYSVGQAILTEIMMSILLVFAVLQSAVDLGSPIAAFAIGLSIVIDIFVGAKVSGACMNPSLSFGPAVVAGQWANYWVYWAGPIAGALIALLIHKFLLASRRNRFLTGDFGITAKPRDENERSERLSP